jgi:uncharacterized protein YdeI (YjbR/CyaY-like superfamily)
VSRDERIDTYIGKAQPFAQPILEHIRTRLHIVLPAAQESLKWSMPAYLLNGKIILISAAFKEHVALNFWRGQELRGKQANADAMGQFGKIRTLGELPSDQELDQLIEEAAELSKSAPASRKPKGAPRPAPELHPQFAAALANAPKAREALEAFPASAQRDYLEWIGEAKQDATRQKRIASAVEWLNEGKRRNWKYQHC